MKAFTMVFLLILCSAFHCYAQCNAPNGSRVTLSITQPIAEKVVVTNINTNILTIKAAPSSVNDSKLTWKFETFKFIGAKNTGRQVAIGLSDWPAHSFFGNGKKIELTYDGGIGDAKKKS
ncbi:MAG: hypothetical protein JXR40_08305 [Pontiellaceae bacterium]|nr:hypothetical protein [Pontiellaceae bacterium]